MDQATLQAGLGTLPDYGHPHDESSAAPCPLNSAAVAAGIASIPHVGIGARLYVNHSKVRGTSSSSPLSFSPSAASHHQDDSIILPAP